MAEWRLFREGTIPEVTTAAWYQDRERADHLNGTMDHRVRLSATIAEILRVLSAFPHQSVGDFGAGDGGLLWQASREWAARPGAHRVTWWGYDLCPANVDAAVRERKVNVKLYDFTAAAARIRWPALAVCCETLEHLADPHNWARAMARRCDALVCSSPADERPGAAYEGHTWCWDETGYQDMLTKSGWDIAGTMRAGAYQIVTAVSAR